MRFLDNLTVELSCRIVVRALLFRKEYDTRKAVGYSDLPLFFFPQCFNVGNIFGAACCLFIRNVLALANIEYRYVAINS